MTNSLRMTIQDGTIRESGLTGEQTMDTMQGRGVAYIVRDESVVLDDDGQIIIHRESAIPQQLGEAA